MEIREEKPLNKKAIFAFLLASCIIAAFFAYLYIDLNRKLEAVSVVSGIFGPSPRSPLEIYDEVKDSIVLIEKRENSSQGMITKNICSGFIFDKNHILTVYNLTANAGEIRVIFDNKTKIKAKIQGFDEYSNLAVLEISENVTITQSPLLLGESENLHLEEKIHIVAKACGTNTLLISGEVNGVDLPLWLKEEFPLVDVIAFSARVLSSEMLGAPLLNSRGEVIGMIVDLGNITTLGYAISSKMMKRIASSIIKYGEYEHLWLKGVSGIDMTPEIARTMNINFTTGFLVTDVDPDVLSQLEAKKKLQAGDIIIQINSEKVGGMYDIVAYLEENRESRVELTVMRDGEVLKEPIIWPVDVFSPQSSD